jgi:putative tryptophan/tyrosine transport system substrate-binding protein
MIKTIIGLALGSILLALGHPAQAQQPGKFARIGYLSEFDPAIESIRFKAIRQALRELGYIEGQNIATEYRYPEGKLYRLSELATDLVRLKVDIIVAAGGSDGAVRAAKNATKTIPIVMVGAGRDPVEAGLVESLARPGGNVTGVTNLFRNLSGKRLELFKEAVPKITRVAVLHGRSIPSAVRELKDVQTAANTLGLTVRSWEVRGADDFDKVFAALNKQRPDGLYVLSGSAIAANQKRIAAFALKSRLPSMSYHRGFVNAGGLMCYGADLVDSHRRVAYYVDRILKGAKPADLPVEQPTNFELVINLKTAQALGLKIPAHLLMEADRVIE